jgi:hypothetical protein
MSQIFVVPCDDSTFQGIGSIALVGQEVVFFNLHYGVVSLRLPYLLLKILVLRLFACYERCFLWELFKLYILRPCKAGGHVLRWVCSGASIASLLVSGNNRGENRLSVITFLGGLSRS